MRHAVAYRKLNRSPAHRRALLRNLATSFFRFGRFETTLAKAKELRGVTEQLISMAREDTLHARRKAYSYLQDKDVVHKLFAEIGPKYRSRPGGYTRVIRSRYRHGDAAPMAVISLVEEGQKKASAKKKGSRRTKGAGKSGQTGQETASSEATAS